MVGYGKWLSVTATLFALTLSGCTPQGTPTAEPTASQTTEAPATEIAPLTGVEVASGTLAHPALLAKIDNQELARPQIGLNQADIVFEELVEGGITRYVAVWHSTIPTKIGPIRSIRPMDPDIASPFGGLITYSGGQQRFIDMMQNTPVKNVIHGSEGTGNIITRDPNRIMPHDVVVDAEQLVGQNSEIAPPPAAFAFTTGDAIPSAVAKGYEYNRLTILFSDYNEPSWQFDKKSGNYLRFQAGGAVDADEAGKQLTATNIIVQVVKETSEYGYVPRANVVGEGYGWLSTGGHSVEIQWKKDSATDMTHFYLGDGTEIVLAPGRTWIELMPDTGSFKGFPK